MLRAGARELARELERNGSPPEGPAEYEFPDEWIDDGAEIVVGEGSPGQRVLEAVATPGHTRGHVVFADPAGELLFAGDHVLPRITPSIGLRAGPCARARSPTSSPRSSSCGRGRTRCCCPRTDPPGCACTSASTS